LPKASAGGYNNLTMILIKICNRIVEYSFYCLFLLVPLAFTSATSELFELNKMWLTWGLTIVITMAWFVKMILQRRILFQRTPLDIPIGLFLISQIISTIFSLDSHVSFWGYYSRFNGGLLSIISYILLYYAFLSNFETNIITITKRFLSLSLISGLIVALWGLPSHFGYDPTCLIFRGTFDVSCWTADFMPKIRIFSTLGQPDWLAAYLAILIPIAIAYAIKNLKSEAPSSKQNQITKTQNFKFSNLFGIWNFGFGILILVALFYIDLLYTRARSGVLGIWFSLIFFAAAYFWLNGKAKISISKEKLKSPLAILVLGFLILTFIIGTPISQLQKFTLEGIGGYFQKHQNQNPKTSETKKNAVPAPTPIQSFEGGTESADIRLNVWKGAINAWENNPIFGTGVETFAFAYYKYKPIAHNLTSEWNFLYNKAHNEYLNYLATTGAFGLGTYLFMIGFFLFLCVKQISKSKFLISNQAPNSKPQLGQLEIRSIRNLNLILALLAGYISILITNFFGFSVVITNIYLFMIPAFIFVLTDMIKPKSSAQSVSKSAQVNTSIWQWTPIFFIFVTSCFLLITLFRFWEADIAYALGYNLDRAGEYQQAYPSLHKAVELRKSEPIFRDELSINDAIFAAGLILQKDQSATKDQTISTASSLAQEAINTSNEIVSKSPNNAVFWKTRVRLFYTLSQIDSRYLPKALEAIEKASILGPNDANISYNLGVLYGQNNNIQKGIEALEKTIKLKPDYRDAHYALGLYYHTASLDTNGKVVVNESLNQKAIAQMQYILDHLSPKDSAALESIKNWVK